MSFFTGTRAKVFKSKDKILDLTKNSIEGFDSIPSNYKILTKSSHVELTIYEEGFYFYVFKATGKASTSGWLHLLFTEDFDLSKELLNNLTELLYILDLVLIHKGFDNFCFEIFKFFSSRNIPIEPVHSILKDELKATIS